MKFDDGISHNLQDRIDTVMDNVRNIRNESKLWDERHTLFAIYQMLEEIRDDIPCTCGEESK